MKYIINKCTEIFNGRPMLDQLSFSLTDKEKAQKEAIYSTITRALPPLSRSMGI
jgi:hypothetical protein